MLCDIEQYSTIFHFRTVFLSCISCLFLTSLCLTFSLFSSAVLLCWFSLNSRLPFLYISITRHEKDIRSSFINMHNTRRFFKIQEDIGRQVQYTISPNLGEYLKYMSTDITITQKEVSNKRIGHWCGFIVMASTIQRVGNMLIRHVGGQSWHPKYDLFLCMLKLVDMCVVSGEELFIHIWGYSS